MLPEDARVGQMVRLQAGKDEEQYGIVEQVFHHSWIRVRWENGSSGLMYWDVNATANAYRLELCDADRETQ